MNYLSSASRFLNGEETGIQPEFLEALDCTTSINLGLYRMEHAPFMDVKVTAGEGTVKTRTMVSRIHYLVWKHHVEPANL